MMPPHALNWGAGALERWMHGWVDDWDRQSAADITDGRLDKAPTKPLVGLRSIVT
jgi:hypothetical protein